MTAVFERAVWPLPPALARGGSPMLHAAWFALDAAWFALARGGSPMLHAACCALDAACFALDAACFALDAACFALDAACFALDAACCALDAAWFALDAARFALGCLPGAERVRHASIVSAFSVLRIAASNRRSVCISDVRRRLACGLDGRSRSGHTCRQHRTFLRCRLRLS